MDRATHIPSLGVGANAQALGVPQLSDTKLVLNPRDVLWKLI